MIHKILTGIISIVVIGIFAYVLGTNNSTLPEYIAKVQKEQKENNESFEKLDTTISLQNLVVVRENNAFLKRIDTVNEREYLVVDLTEYSDCSGIEDPDCIENIKNDNKTQQSFLLGKDVIVGGVYCLKDNDKFVFKDIITLKSALNNFYSFRECNSYYSEEQWDGLLYVLGFNEKDEIVSIQSHQVYNQ